MPRPSKKPPGEYLAAHFLPFSNAWPEDGRRRLHDVLDGLAEAIRRYYGRPHYDAESGRHIGKEMPLHEVTRRASNWLQSLHEPHDLTLAPKIDSLHLRPEARRAVELLDQLIRTPDFAAIRAETRKELHRLAGLQKTHIDRRTRAAKKVSVDSCVALANQAKRENPRWGTDRIARNVAKKLSAPGSEIKPKTIRNRLKKHK